MTSPLNTSYDRVPYKSSAVSATHPRFLATLAALLGLEPPPIERCRVLEIGCADAANLISLGVTLPEGEFHGIDLSQRQIEDGRRAIEAVGVTNVALRAMSIADVGDSFGRFDYILCHGVYSWVSETLRERILDICARCLTPHGLAFISYNAYPGWHLRGIVRDLLTRFDRRDAEPAFRIASARALLEFFAENSSAASGTYKAVLREEAQGLRERTDHLLFHDLLEDENHPFTIRQFAAQVASHGLEYLAEPEIDPLLTGEITPSVNDRLREMAGDHVDLEQLYDDLTCRFFRRSIVCRAGRQPDRARLTERVTGLHAAALMRPSESDPDVRSGATLEFHWPDGSHLSTNDPYIKAALLRIARAWPRAVAFDALWTEVALAVGPAEERLLTAKRQRLADVLLRCFAAGRVELSIEPPRPAGEVSDRPLASPLARFQARNGARLLTNLRHALVGVDETARRLIARLDGTHDLPALQREWPDLVPGGEQPTLQDYLRHIASRGLLIG